MPSKRAKKSPKLKNFSQDPISKCSEMVSQGELGNQPKVVEMKPKPEQKDLTEDDLLLEKFLENNSHFVVTSKSEGFFAVLTLDLRKEIWKNLDSNLEFSRACQVNWKWNEEASNAWETWARSNHYLDDEKFWKKHNKSWKWILQSQVEFQSGKERNGVGMYYYYPPQVTGNETPLAVYRGEWRKNKRHGLGKYVEFESKNCYIGEWRNDKRHGKGINTEKEETYTGEYRHDKKEGSGVCSWTSKDHYEGRYSDNRFHGYGIFTRASGEKYIGHWKFGMRNDTNARMYWSSGDMFEGGILNNKRSGFGKYVYRTGDVYIGEWLNNHRHGEAVYCYTNGGRFEGRFVNDERSGKGRFLWPDGDRYEGSWEHGSRHGRGALVRKNGERIVQSWAEPLHINYSTSLPDKFPQDISHNVGI